MIPAHRTLPNAVDRLLQDQPLSQGKVAFAWRAAVGAACARATDVALGADGAIEVRVSDPSWRREIERLMPLVRARLARLLGEAARVRVKG